MTDPLVEEARRLHLPKRLDDLIRFCHCGEVVPCSAIRLADRVEELASTSGSVMSPRELAAKLREQAAFTEAPPFPYTEAHVPSPVPLLREAADIITRLADRVEELEAAP